MFSDFDKAGEIWVGTGPRERHKRVTSKEKFVCPPSVTWQASGDAINPDEIWDVLGL
jgi:hypothetical protein